MSFIGSLPSAECYKVSPWLKVSLKRRKSLKLQAERMRAVKARRSSSVQETVKLSAETTAEEPLPELSAETTAEEPLPELSAETTAEEPLPELSAETTAEEPLPELSAETTAEEPLPELSAETTAEEPLPGPSGLNESVLLHAADADDDSLTESENESSDDDYESADFRLEDVGVYQDWLAILDREDVKMMAMMLHDNYTSRFGLTKTSTAAEVVQLLGFNNKTMRLWRKDFLANKGEFSEYRRGSYARYTILMDEEYRDTALEWVRANTFVKGSPNLTASRFRVWVNNVLLPIVVQHHPQIKQQIQYRSDARYNECALRTRLREAANAFTRGSERGHTQMQTRSQKEANAFLRDSECDRTQT